MLIFLQIIGANLSGRIARQLDRGWPPDLPDQLYRYHTRPSSLFVSASYQDGEGV